MSPEEAQSTTRSDEPSEESLGATGLRSDVVTLFRAASIRSIATNAIRMCGWFSRLNRILALEAIPITLNTRAIIGYQPFPCL